MASKLSDSGGRKNTPMLIGIGVVVIVLALVVVNYPPGDDGFSGTIGKRRAATGQFDKGDVRLGDASVSRLMQDNEFKSLVTSSEFQSMTQNAEFMSMLSSGEFQALLGNAEFGSALKSGNVDKVMRNSEEG